MGPTEQVTRASQPQHRSPTTSSWRIIGRGAARKKNRGSQTAVGGGHQGRGGGKRGVALARIAFKHGAIEQSTIFSKGEATHRASTRRLQNTNQL